MGVFKHFRIVRKEKPLQIDPDLAGAFAALLFKLIGETIHGRLLRAFLAAMVTALMAYFVPQASLPDWSPSSPVGQPEPAREVERHYSACTSDHLDWQGTASAH